jgi:hypothetical protein
VAGLGAGNENNCIFLSISEPQAVWPLAVALRNDPLVHKLDCFVGGKDLPNSEHWFCHSTKNVSTLDIWGLQFLSLEVKDYIYIQGVSRL